MEKIAEVKLPVTCFLVSPSQRALPQAFSKLTTKLTRSKQKLCDRPASKREIEKQEENILLPRTTKSPDVFITPFFQREREKNNFYLCRKYVSSRNYDLCDVT